MPSKDVAQDVSSVPAAKSSRDELKKQVKRYCCTFREEDGRLTSLQEHIDSVDDPFSRATISGHITASGIAMHEQKILMIFHPFLKTWLLPGGHVELGETPLQAAEREFLEETGLLGAEHPWHRQHSIPLDIDTHRIPANPKKKEQAHNHYDFRYVLCVDGAVEAAKREMAQIRWMPMQNIATANLKLLAVKLKKQGLLKK
jgi:8-oxo-dGTP pyrophosphatase MutT (NUDIX family)